MWEVYRGGLGAYALASRRVLGGGGARYPSTAERNVYQGPGTPVLQKKCVQGGVQVPPYCKKNVYRGRGTPVLQKETFTRGKVSLHCKKKRVPGAMYPCTAKRNVYQGQRTPVMLKRNVYKGFFLGYPRTARRGVYQGFLRYPCTAKRNVYKGGLCCMSDLLVQISGDCCFAFTLLPATRGAWGVSPRALHPRVEKISRALHPRVEKRPSSLALSRGETSLASAQWKNPRCNAPFTRLGAVAKEMSVSNSFLRFNRLTIKGPVGPPEQRRGSLA